MSEFSLSESLGQILKSTGQVLATAESCTGGGVSAAITDIAGSSEWFDRAFVTYSNNAKMEMLGVKAETLDSQGAVSEAVVREMVSGALANSQATIAVAISGIAGPGGGSETKPVGTVCFGWADNLGWEKICTYHFEGDRSQVRQQAVETALKVLYEKLDESTS